MSHTKFYNLKQVALGGRPKSRFSSIFQLIYFTAAIVAEKRQKSQLLVLINKKLLIFVGFGFFLWKEERKGI